MLIVLTVWVCLPILVALTVWEKQICNYKNFISFCIPKNNTNINEWSEEDKKQDEIK